MNRRPDPYHGPALSRELLHTNHRFATIPIEAKLLASHQLSRNYGAETGIRTRDPTLTMGVLWPAELSRLMEWYNFALASYAPYHLVQGYAGPYSLQQSKYTCFYTWWLAKRSPPKAGGVWPATRSPLKADVVWCWEKDSNLRSHNGVRFTV